MTDYKKDIEKLFQESFDSYEADVDPSMWNNIADKINSVSVPSDPSSLASSSSGVSAGISVAKIALIATTAGIMSFAAYELFSTDGLDESNAEISIATPEQPSEVLDNDLISKEGKSDVPKAGVTKIKENQTRTIVEPSAEDLEKEQSILDGTTVVDEPASHQKTGVGQKVNQSNAKKQEEPIHAKTEANTSDLAEEPAQVENAEEEQKNLSPEEIISEMDIFEASIYASVKQGKQPLEVYFENRGSYSDQVKWIFRDGGSTIGASASHVFDLKGSHWVILEISNSKGQLSRDSLEINVEGKAYINVPNTFTPNGDGYNEAFMVETDYIRDFKCTIFDRNANLVYEWTNVHGHWDGRDMHNNIVQEGVYFYVIEAVDMDGQSLDIKKGSVTLFR